MTFGGVGVISVLMSVYNEKSDWVKLAVESVLNQTITDLEFIIVIDNPSICEEVKSLLEHYVQSDARLKLIYNQENIGLANSLNLALSYAKGNVIARMDADDISVRNRFEIEYENLIRSKADMISCQRINIDEDGNEISKSQYDGKDPGLALPYTNFIVHPSVMIYTETLRKLKGYRNFKKSQDYDLWLRMLSAGYNIKVLKEHLLYYRIRKDSISGKNPLEQYYISEYQRLLFKERERKGKDSFSETNLDRYLKKKRITEKRIVRYLKARNFINESIVLYREKNLNFIPQIIKATVLYPEIVIKTLEYAIHMKFGEI